MPDHPVETCQMLICRRSELTFRGTILKAGPEMSSVVSKVMATVNAPYGVSVTPEQLASRITDPESAAHYDHAAFAFLSEVSIGLQKAFIETMGLDAQHVTTVAKKFSDLAGYRLVLAA